MLMSEPVPWGMTFTDCNLHQWEEHHRIHSHHHVVMWFYTNHTLSAAVFQLLDGGTPWSTVRTSLITWFDQFQFSSEPVTLHHILFHSGASASQNQFCRSGSVWAGPIWSDQVWSGLVESGLVWFSLIWSDLIRSDPVWSGLVQSERRGAERSWEESRHHKYLHQREALLVPSLVNSPF